MPSSQGWSRGGHGHGRGGEADKRGRGNGEDHRQNLQRCYTHWDHHRQTGHSERERDPRLRWRRMEKEKNVDGGMNRMTSGDNHSRAFGRVRRRPSMPTGNGANADGSSVAVPLSPSLFFAHVAASWWVPCQPEPSEPTAETTDSPWRTWHRSTFVCLYAEPREGARATVASGSAMASFRVRGGQRKMAWCQTEITHSPIPIRWLELPAFPAPPQIGRASCRERVSSPV